MRTALRRGAFTLTELLVVLTVIMVLMSMLLLSVGAVYGEAERVRCQHHLEQIHAACRLFCNAHGGTYPKAWNNEVRMSGALVANVRWYQAIEVFLSNPAVLGCPIADTDLTRTSAATMPVQGFLAPQGRNADLWDEIRWDGDLLLFRHWMDEQMPGGFSYETGEVEVTVELLEGKDQFWNCVHFGGSQFRPVEIERLAEFNRQGHGIHLLSEYFDGIGGEEVNQLGAALDYGIHAGDGGYVYTWITYEPDNHPVMKGVRQMATAYTPAGFVKTTGPQDTAAQLIGKMHHRDINSSTSPTHDYWHVAAWDGGVGRVVAQGGWNCIGNHFERVPSTGTNDVKTYCLNVAQWLGQYREGTSTYGYNNRVGRTARGPSADTVLLMDYCDWEIDRDGSPPDHDETFIAPRHGGRANVMFVDGHVRALRIEEIKPGLWTIETGD